MLLNIKNTISSSESKKLDFVRAKCKIWQEEFFHNQENKYFIAKDDMLQIIEQKGVGKEEYIIFTSPHLNQPPHE